MSKIFRTGTGGLAGRLTLLIEIKEPCMIFFECWGKYAEYLVHDMSYELLNDSEIALRQDGYKLENESDEKAQEALEEALILADIYEKRDLGIE